MSQRAHYGSSSSSPAPPVAAASAVAAAPRRNEHPAPRRLPILMRLPSGKWQVQVFFEGQSCRIQEFDSRREATVAFELAKTSTQNVNLICQNSQKASASAKCAKLSTKRGDISYPAETTTPSQPRVDAKESTDPVALDHNKLRDKQSGGGTDHSKIEAKSSDTKPVHPPRVTKDWISAGQDWISARPAPRKGAPIDARQFSPIDPSKKGSVPAGQHALMKGHPYGSHVPQPSSSKSELLGAAMSIRKKVIDDTPQLGPTREGGLGKTREGPSSTSNLITSGWPASPPPDNGAKWSATPKAAERHAPPNGAEWPTPPKHAKGSKSNSASPPKSSRPIATAAVAKNDAASPNKNAKDLPPPKKRAHEECSARGHDNLAARGESAKAEHGWDPNFDGPAAAKGGGLDLLYSAVKFRCGGGADGNAPEKYAVPAGGVWETSEKSSAPCDEDDDDEMGDLVYNSSHTAKIRADEVISSTPTHRDVPHDFSLPQPPLPSLPHGNYSHLVTQSRSSPQRVGFGNYYMQAKETLEENGFSTAPVPPASKTVRPAMKPKVAKEATLFTPAPGAKVAKSTPVPVHGYPGKQPPKATAVGSDVSHCTAKSHVLVKGVGVPGNFAEAKKATAVAETKNAEKKEKKDASTAKKSKPNAKTKLKKNSDGARPYNRYNIFYIFEREKLLQSQGGTSGSSFTLTRDVEEDKRIMRENYPNLRLPPLPPRFADLKVPEGWFIPSSQKARRRPHRKTHGVVSFQWLVKSIAKSWKDVDEKTLEWLTEVEKALKKNAMKMLLLKKAKQENEAMVDKGIPSESPSAKAEAAKPVSKTKVQTKSLKPVPKTKVQTKLHNVKIAKHAAGALVQAQPPAANTARQAHETKAATLRTSKSSAFSNCSGLSLAKNFVPPSKHARDSQPASLPPYAASTPHNTDVAWTGHTSPTPYRTAAYNEGMQYDTPPSPVTSNYESSSNATSNYERHFAGDPGGHNKPNDERAGTKRPANPPEVTREDRPVKSTPPDAVLSNADEELSSSEELRRMMMNFSGAPRTKSTDARGGAATTALDDTDGDLRKYLRVMKCAQILQEKAARELERRLLPNLSLLTDSTAGVDAVEEGRHQLQKYYDTVSSVQGRMSHTDRIERIREAEWAQMTLEGADDGNGGDGPPSGSEKGE